MESIVTGKGERGSVVKSQNKNLDVLGPSNELNETVGNENGIYQESERFSNEVYETVVSQNVKPSNEDEDISSLSSGVNVTEGLKTNISPKEISHDSKGLDVLEREEIESQNIRSSEDRTGVLSSDTNDKNETAITKSSVLEEKGQVKLSKQSISIGESITPIDFDGEELLWVIMENHENELLLFIKDEECILSKEVLQILQTYQKSAIIVEVIDVHSLTNEVPDFYEALKLFSGSDPPVLICKGEYSSTYSDIVKATKFGRLDLLLEPSVFPYYHIVIVGCGSVALSVIRELKRNGGGLKVALVQWTLNVPKAYELLGGLQGCLPRNLLWNAIKDLRDGSAYETESTAEKHSSEDCELQWAQVVSSICSEILSTNALLRKEIASLDIDFYRGSIEFVGPDTLNVTPHEEAIGDKSITTSEEGEKYSDDNGGSRSIVGMNFIICGGSISHALNCCQKFPGIENCLTIEDFIVGSDYPETALIIGNTPEVFELAYLLALCGTEVAVFSERQLWLPGYDKEAVTKIMESFKALKVIFVWMVKILFIQKLESGYNVGILLQNDYETTCVFSTVIGDYTRTPISSIINVEKANVELDPWSRKIVVNEKFKSKNPAIWAFGSVAQGHLESLEFEMAAGRRTVRLILGELDNIPLPSILPQVLLAPLECGFVGESGELARHKYKKGLLIYTYHSSLIFATDYKSLEPAYEIKIVCRGIEQNCSHGFKEERVLGIHILGKNATSLIMGFASSLAKELTKREFLEQWSVEGCTELRLIQCGPPVQSSKSVIQNEFPHQWAHLGKFLSFVKSSNTLKSVSLLKSTSYEEEGSVSWNVVNDPSTHSLKLSGGSFISRIISVQDIKPQKTFTTAVSSPLRQRKVETIKADVNQPIVAIIQKEFVTVFKDGGIARTGELEGRGSLCDFLPFPSSSSQTSSEEQGCSMAEDAQIRLLVLIYLLLLLALSLLLYMMNPFAVI